MQAPLRSRPAAGVRGPAARPACRGRRPREGLVPRARRGRAWRVDRPRRNVLRLVSEHDVLGDREWCHERELLVHHGDACRLGIPDRAEPAHLPSSSTSPVYDAWGCTPPSTRSSVDLPAPFSPTSAWISPARRSKSTASSARTPGKALVDAPHLEERIAGGSLAALLGRRVIRRRRGHLSVGGSCRVLVLQTLLVQLRPHATTPHSASPESGCRGPGARRPRGRSAWRPRMPRPVPTGRPELQAHGGSAR